MWSLFQFTLGSALALFFDRDFPGAAWLRGLLLAAWSRRGWWWACCGTGFCRATSGWSTTVLARHRTLWVHAGLFLVLMLQVLPPSLMVTPIFVGFAYVGLLDLPRTAVVLAVAAKTMPFYVILCRAAFMTVPRELEEAALVDGNSRAGAFAFIVLALARNGILVAALLIFMQGFGEYVYFASIIADNRLRSRRRWA